MRKKIVAGNWKMNKTAAEALKLAEGIKAALGSFSAVECVLCPPFTDIWAVSKIVKGSQIGWGAQNAHWEKEGAFTGEISTPMLVELGCQYVILGHSERRQHFGETDLTVNKRARAVLDAGMKPIVCVGETLAERDSNTTFKVIERQIREGLKGFAGADWDKLVVAYEPVWAIGTGKTATSAQAQEVHAFIRKLLGELAGAAVAATIRIQYGGSMKPENAKELMSQPDIDGGLIGGAALKVDQFIAIVTAGA